MSDYGVRHIGTATAGGARKLTLVVTVPTYWTDQEVTRHMELAAKKFTSGRAHPFDGPEVFDDYELPGKEGHELRGPALDVPNRKPYAGTWSKEFLEEPVQEIGIGAEAIRAGELDWSRIMVEPSETGRAIREPVSEEKLKGYPRILELLREKKRMLRRGGASE